MSEQLLFTPAQAAQALQVSRTRLYELLNAGRLRSIKIGASRRIPRAALEEYISKLLSEQEEAVAM